MSSFLEDVKSGLTAPQKSLSSKYFYDEKGSRIFQEIMNLKEYYLPLCELEILHNSSVDILDEIPFEELDVIELGAGDGSKTVIFLEEAVKSGKHINYLPLDISGEILKVNKDLVQARIPSLNVEVFVGDYLKTLSQLKDRRQARLLLFMGSNIGNFPQESAIEFIRFINDFLRPGDYFLMGVDLKKNPHVIRAAYNDSKGVTKKFNLNLLERINKELKANFHLDSFEHYGVYNPLTGSALSYLVSLKEQKVKIGDVEIIFDKYETIHTEISQKYSLKDLDKIASKTGFEWDRHFTDQKEYFSLSLMRK